MKKLILKIKNYFEHRRNYKTLKYLVFKNAEGCDFDECFHLMTKLSTFKKHGFRYHSEIPEGEDKNVLYKIYPEFIPASPYSKHLLSYKNEIVLSTIYNSPEEELYCRLMKLATTNIMDERTCPGLHLFDQ